MKKLLSDNNDLSHKRCIALVVVCLIAALVANFFGIIIQIGKI
jgi:hypothetical protein|nr:MAG TPA: hypothetical protein [Crassvirales sp.]